MNNTPTPTNARRQTWETYAESWKATTSKERHALFSKSLAADCAYRDPLALTQGWDALEVYMNQFHQQVPGGHFVTTRFSQHHDHSLTHWNMCDAGGQVIGEGVSYGEYNAEGKLIAMTGFFETP